MTIAASDVKTFAPEFDALDDADIDLVIARVERRTNREAWGVKADDGVLFLVCHYLTIAARIAATGAQARGPLTSETVGPLSRTFASPGALSLTNAFLASSTYGQAYTELRGLVFASRVL